MNGLRSLSPSADSMAGISLFSTVSVTTSVLKYRLNHEYNVEIIMEGLPYEYIRWIENPDIDLDALRGTSDMKKIKDLKGRPLLLFINSWSIGMTLERNEGLELSEFGRA